MIQCEDISLTN